MGPHREFQRPKTKKRTEAEIKFLFLWDNLYRLAIVKGLYEHNDGTYFFGSTAGFKDHLANCAHAGWITGYHRNYVLTDLGRQIYHEADLHRYSGKAYGWCNQIPRS